MYQSSLCPKHPLSYKLGVFFHVYKIYDFLCTIIMLLSNKEYVYFHIHTNIPKIN